LRTETLSDENFTYERSIGSGLLAKAGKLY
jgi:hypothetical protein